MYSSHVIPLVRFARQVALPFASLLLAIQGSAFVFALEPTIAFTARGGSLIAGGTNREETVWKSTFLDIKEGTGDRVVLEYDVRGQSQQDKVILNLKLANLDAPEFTSIFLYYFEGNGLVNATDYGRTQNLITVFTDNGLADNNAYPYFLSTDLDVTNAYNEAISNDFDYLGFLFRNTTLEPQYARYRITNIPNGNITPNGFDAFPTLLFVPEPSSVCYCLSVPLALLFNSRKSQR